MRFLKGGEKFFFLVRGPPKKWGSSILAKKSKIYDIVVAAINCAKPFPHISSNTYTSLGTMEFELSCESTSSSKVEKSYHSTFVVDWRNERYAIILELLFALEKLLIVDFKFPGQNRKLTFFRFSRTTTFASLLHAHYIVDLNKIDAHNNFKYTL